MMKEEVKEGGRAEDYQARSSSRSGEEEGEEEERESEEEVRRKVEADGETCKRYVSTGHSAVAALQAARGGQRTREMRTLEIERMARSKLQPISSCTPCFLKQTRKGQNCPSQG